MNKTKDYYFTIIIPVYNEEESLPRVKQYISDYIKKASVKTCALFVNDGSTDSSLKIIQHICNEYQNFYYINLSRNHGLSTAMKAGIDYVESPILGYIDADLQTVPEDFELLLPYSDEYDLVSGIRANRKDSGFKKFQSKFANGFRRKMTGDSATDTGCPLKIIKSERAKRIPFFNGMHRFLAALISLNNGTYKEVPVQHFPRIEGKSKYHLWNRLTGPFVDCFAFRWMKKRVINYHVNLTNLQNDSSL